MEKITDKDTGEKIDKPIPVLEDVPLCWPRAGGFNFIAPIKPGDEVLVFFADMCVDNWWQSGGLQPQAEIRRHDLSDGFAIPAAWNQTRRIKPAGFDPNLRGARIQTDDASTWVEVRNNKTVHVKGSLVVTGSISVGGSSKFGHEPEDGSPAPTHNFKGELFQIEDIPEVDIINAIKFVINSKEYQDHTHAGQAFDKYY
jgi:hypothetical protein